MVELLKNRRSCRKYLKKQIDDQQIRLLSQTALLSPSSRGLNPWQFIFVNNPDTIKALSKAKAHGSAFARLAPLVVVITADSKVSDVWIEDCSISAILIQLQAEKLGLGSCWVQLRNRFTIKNEPSSKYVQKLLNIPENFEVPFFIAIGHPDEDKPPYKIEELAYSKLHLNEFNQTLNAT